MLGIEPHQEIQEDEPVYNDYWDMLDTVKRSERKDLQTTGRTQINRFVAIYASASPADFLKWAKGKGYDIPEELISVLDSEPEQEEPAEDNLDPRERTSLLQIIAVLAKEAKLDLKKHQAAAATLQQMGAQDNTGSLRASTPDVPHLGSDRAQDNWVPLFAIADAIGGNWPERARKAYTTLTDTGEADDTAGPMLLHDIKSVFDDKHRDHILAPTL
jgi:hypothetical protein